MQLGWQEVWGNDRSDLSVLEARAYLAVDNETARQADPDIDALSQLLAAVHAEDESLAALAAGGEDELRRLLEMAGQEPMGEGEGIEHQSLAERFIVPPFSVLDARQGYWQQRKQAWLALGIQSELGRGDSLTWTGEAITEPGLNYYRNRQGTLGVIAPNVERERE